MANFIRPNKVPGARRAGGANFCSSSLSCSKLSFGHTLVCLAGPTIRWPKRFGGNNVEQQLLLLIFGRF
jgi:hypothetical protein